MACELKGETRWPGNSENYKKLKDILSDRDRGFKGCKMLSLGNDCVCELCLLDNLCAEAKT